MTGTLYLVPNTLGHSIDSKTHPLVHIIPNEVQTIAARLDYFIAENAKTTRAFLKLVAASYPLAQPLQSINIVELNVKTNESVLPDLLAPILAGQDAGLISESGMPAIADPGANLVRLAHRHNIPVKPLIGPSSLLLALMASGLNGQNFAFNGYLPTDTVQRSKRIKALEERSRRERQTQLFIETPYRNGALLEALANHCKPDTLVCVATNLTALDESIRTQNAATWKKQIASGNTPDFHRKPTVFLLLSGQ